MKILFWLGCVVLSVFWVMGCVGVFMAVLEDNELLSDQLLVGGLAGLFLTAVSACIVWILTDVHKQIVKDKS